MRTLDLLIGCARCEGEHHNLQAHQFERPVIDSDGTAWDFWMTCPATGDPILLRDASALEDTSNEQGTQRRADGLS